MKNSVPQYGLMKANAEFSEPEDIFDIVDDDEPLPTPVVRQGRVSLDLFTPVDTSYFPDDSNYPNQLIVLPWRPERS
jgi:hypothetical protein